MRDRDHDTCLLQSRLIARGLSVARLPGGVLIARAPDSDNVLAFTDTVPKETTFEGAALSLKVSAAWRLLAEAGFNAPRWKIFRSPAVKSAGRYAEVVGFPLIVSGIKGEHRRVVREQSDLTSAMTELGQEKSLRKVIVRSHTDGDEAKVLVIGDKALSFSVDSSAKRDPEVERIAIQSKAAIPGLALAEVRMTVERIADAQGSRSEVIVTGFSPAPTLRDYATSDRGAAELADKLIEAQAKATGIVLGEPVEEVSTSFTVAGTVNSSIFSQMMQSVLAEAHCQETSAPEILSQESIRFHVSGAPSCIAELSIHALRGIGPERNRAHAITIENKRVAL